MSHECTCSSRSERRDPLRVRYRSAAWHPAPRRARERELAQLRSSNLSDRSRAGRYRKWGQRRDLLRGTEHRRLFPAYASGGQRCCARGAEAMASPAREHASGVAEGCAVIPEGSTANPPGAGGAAVTPPTPSRDTVAGRAYNDLRNLARKQHREPAE